MAQEGEDRRLCQQGLQACQIAQYAEAPRPIVCRQAVSVALQYYLNRSGLTSIVAGSGVGPCNSKATVHSTPRPCSASAWLGCCCCRCCRSRQKVHGFGAAEGSLAAAVGARGLALLVCCAVAAVAVAASATAALAVIGGSASVLPDCDAAAAASHATESKHACVCFKGRNTLLLRGPKQHPPGLSYP